MANVYLLDANIIIAALKEHANVLRHMNSALLGRLRLSAIVLGELEFGAEKSAYGPRNRARLASIANSIDLVVVDGETARSYARLRALLERRGTPIGANDLWIAAQALSIDATLVTDNEREFSCVPNLRIENWLTA